MVQKIARQSKHKKPKNIEARTRTLRTCFLAALMLSVDGSPIAQGPIAQGQENGQEIGQQTQALLNQGQTNLILTRNQAIAVGTVEPVSEVPLVEGEMSAAPNSPNGLIQSPSDFSSQSLPGSNYPYPSVSPREIIPHPLDPSGLVSKDDEHIKMLEPDDFLPSRLDFYDLSIASYTSYRFKENAITYMPGNADQFGWLTFGSPNYLSRGVSSGLTANMNIHLLSGPLAVPLPPRLYDFELGYQVRNSLSDIFSYECSTMVGVYSDFEDSARDGVRFPSHAVGMFHPGPRADWVFGVDYLGRDDVKVLPVAGFVWHDPKRPELRYEMVFPRPRIDLTLSPQSRIYCSGLLGGGTWDIEFPDNSNDVMTYRDYKLAFGIEQADSDGDISSWELGWVFGRKLEFRDRPHEVGFGDAFVIRFVTRK